MGEWAYRDDTGDVGVVHLPEKTDFPGDFLGVGEGLEDVEAFLDGHLWREWVGGWVGWVGRWIEKEQGFRMRCCGWVGGWVGGRRKDVPPCR